MVRYSSAEKKESLQCFLLKRRKQKQEDEGGKSSELKIYMSLEKWGEACVWWGRRGDGDGRCGALKVDKQRDAWRHKTLSENEKTERLS